MIRPSNLSGRNTLARSRRLIVSIETFHRSANSRLVNNESSIVFTKSFVCIVRSQALALQKGKPLRPAVRAFQGRSTKIFLDIHNIIIRSNYDEVLFICPFAGYVLSCARLLVPDPVSAYVYLESLRKLSEPAFRRIPLLLDPEYVGHPITDDPPLQLYRA
jgi:hypothetical protein